MSQAYPKYPCQIVIAWTETSSRPIRERRTDLGERPVMEDFEQPFSVMWLGEGDEDDVERARNYADEMRENDHYKNKVKVFTYPVSERDPLERARCEILGKPFDDDARAARRRVRRHHV